MRSVLIIEDDEYIAKLIERHFKNEVGIQLVIADTYTKGVSLIAQRKFDLYLIDINLEEYSGFDILKILQKEEAITNRVIVISANADSNNQIEAYNLGASNFVTKPFDFNVLRAILRKNLRAIDSSQPDRISTLQFYLDLKLLKCFSLRSGSAEEVSLTKIEFNLLLALAKNINRVQNKDELSFLGKDFNDPMSYKALEMHIASLRSKLGKDVIKTKRGVGYYISEE